MSTAEEKKQAAAERRRKRFGGGSQIRAGSGKQRKRVWRGKRKGSGKNR